MIPVEKKEVTKLLMENGLTSTQATSKTAQAIVDLFTNDEVHVAMAQAKLEDIKRDVEESSACLRKIQSQFDSISLSIKAITETQEKYGEITDSKAQNALVFYASILALNEKVRAPAKESVIGAGYALYAYLGGQASNSTTPMPQIRFEKQSTGNWYE